MIFFFAFLHTVCGGTLPATINAEKFYSHAKYGDSDYDKKEDCNWVIKGPSKHRVRLRFLTFELEPENDCTYDFVEIYDGDESSNHLYGRYCGNNVSYCLPLCSNAFYPKYFEQRSTFQL